LSLTFVPAANGLVIIPNLIRPLPHIRNREWAAAPGPAICSRPADGQPETPASWWANRD